MKPPMISFAYADLRPKKKPEWALGMGYTLRINVSYENVSITFRDVSAVHLDAAKEKIERRLREMFPSEMHFEIEILL